jgi:hypothetical protein
VVGASLNRGRFYIDGVNEFEVVDKRLKSSLSKSFFGTVKENMEYPQDPARTILGQNYVLVWAESGLHYYRFGPSSANISRTKRLSHKPIEGYKHITLSKITPT